MRVNILVDGDVAWLTCGRTDSTSDTGTALYPMCTASKAELYPIYQKLGRDVWDSRKITSSSL